MKAFKNALLLFVVVFAVLGSIAASQPGQTKHLTEEWFELVPNGSPTTITDWTISSPSSCPEEPSEQVCRIYALTEGIYPDLDDFNDIKMTSNNFTTEYLSKVKYEDLP